MTSYDYKASLQILAEDPPFKALIMAAIQKASTENLTRLQRAFPEIWKEFEKEWRKEVK